MVVAVVDDLMPFSHHSRGGRRIGLGELPGHSEGGADPVLPQRVEHHVCVAKVRSAVDGQRDLGAARQGPVDDTRRGDVDGSVRRIRRREAANPKDQSQRGEDSDDHPPKPGGTTPGPGGTAPGPRGSKYCHESHLQAPKTPSPDTRLERPPCGWTVEPAHVPANQSDQPAQQHQQRPDEVTVRAGGVTTPPGSVRQSRPAGSERGGSSSRWRFAAGPRPVPACRHRPASAARFRPCPRRWASARAPATGCAGLGQRRPVQRDEVVLS